MKNYSFGKITGRFMSKTKPKIVLTFIIAVFVIFSLGTIFQKTGFGRFIADMVYDGGFKEYLYEGKNHGNNGFLTVLATFLGELLLSGLLLATIITFFRSIGERYENGQYRKYHWKKHILFLGYDDMMIGTLKEACDDHNVVIAVPNKVKELREILRRNLSGKQLESVEFVQCNRDDIDDLRRKARINEATKIYIIGQPDEQNHDALNFKSLAMISNECQKAKKEPHIIMYLQNQSSISMLKKQNLNRDNLIEFISDKDDKVYLEQSFLNSNCEYFNFYSDMAFKLLTGDNGIKLDWHSEDKNLAKCPDRQVHLVVMGMTAMGVAIVRESLRLAHPSGTGTRFKITMIDDNASEEMHYFIGRTKELFEYCTYQYHDYDNPEKDFVHTPKSDFLDVEFEFVKCDVAHPKLIEDLSKWAIDEKQLVTLVVCTKQSARNIAVALYLPSKLRTGNNAIPVWVYQNGDDSMKHLLDANNHKQIHLFSVGDDAITTLLKQDPGIAEYERVKKLAIAYEEAYSGTKPEWEKMNAINRWSSIYNIFSMKIKLRAVGISDNFSDIDNGKKDVIDMIEHNRWNVEKLSDGFVPTDETQHEEVVRELENLLEKHTGWRENIDIDVIDSQRETFKKYKNLNIHDNIRSNEDLDDFSKMKDRFLLDGYINLVCKY